MKYLLAIFVPKNIALKASLFLLAIWILTLGIIVHVNDDTLFLYEFDTYEAEKRFFSDKAEVYMDIDLDAVPYLKNAKYTDHDVGIPFIFMYSRRRVRLPVSLKLRVRADKKYKDGKVVIENAVFKYDGDRDSQTIPTRNQPTAILYKKMVRRDNAKEENKEYYETSITIPEIIYKRKDFKLDISGYIVSENKKNPFTVKMEAHYVPDISIMLGWSVIPILLSEGV